MDIQPDIGSGGTDGLQAAAASAQCLPVRFRRNPADARLGTTQPKQFKAYYLHGITGVFQPEVSLPDALSVEQNFAGEEVILLNPGPSVIEVLEIIRRFPEIKCLHIVEPHEANLEAIRSALQQQQAEAGELPELAGYVTDLANLPEALHGRCGLAVEINAVDPKAGKWFRQDVARQISLVLKLGGLFYSGGETIRWTDEVIPLSLVRIPVGTEPLKQAGYSDALPRPVFYLKRLPEAPVMLAEQETLREWWWKGVALIGRTEDTAGGSVTAPFVPRVEDGRGEPNAAPWHFLITKPAVRRPAMEWTPEDGDPFGNLALGSLLQFNAHTGMYVFRVRDCPDVVLKIMKPFEGDIPDDPLEWNKLRKSKTLKRENQALKLLKGLRFIPQHVAHGYDPVTGWYAIVVEYEPGRALSDFLIQQHNRRQRHHESQAEAGQALELVRMTLNSLAIVHDKGLVHLDLKPGHVFLRPGSPEAVLIDWGVARKLNEPLSDDRRSISWLHAAPERADLEVQTSAAIHQDLYAVGVMLLQLASDWDLNGHPRFLIEYFLQHGRMPLAAELEPKLRPHWKWAAPVIARAIRSRKEIPGYAHNRYASAPEMAEDLARHYGSKREGDSNKSGTVL